MTTPRVFVGPDSDPDLEQAVRDGGGQVTALSDAEAVIWNGPDDPQQAAAMVAGKRWIQLPSAGVEAWTSAGVVTDDPVWTSAAGAYSPQVAEHALALLLAAARHLPQYARATSWTAKVDSMLGGSTVALVGVGGIGRRLVTLLAPLDVTIWAVSNSGAVDGAARTVRRDEYRQLLPGADYVVLLAPSTPSTHHMMAAAEFEAMKRTAWLINVARGTLVSTDDLTAALAEEQLGGAALDVTDPEPLPDGHALWTMPNLLITPHSANPQTAHDRSLAERVRDNVQRFAAGASLLGVIDPGQGF